MKLTAAKINLLNIWHLHWNFVGSRDCIASWQSIRLSSHHSALLCNPNRHQIIFQIFDLKVIAFSPPPLRRLGVLQCPMKTKDNSFLDTVINIYSKSLYIIEQNKKGVV